MLAISSVHRLTYGALKRHNNNNNNNNNNNDNESDDLCHFRSLKQTQQGLKVVIISCICFAFIVTLALIITIIVLPDQVSTR